MYCFHCHDVQLRDNLRYHIIFTGAYPGFQRGGCLRSGPIRKVGGGGGGGGQFTSGPKTKRGGGGQFASGPIRKVGGGGGGGGNSLQVRYEKWGGNSLQVRYEKWGEGRYLCLATLSLITINGYNFDQGGAQALHTRARMSLIVVFNFIYSLIVFILETEGSARAP